MGTIARPPFYRAAGIQLIIAGVVSAILAPFDLVVGYSLLMGCLIQVAGSIYFARLAYRYQGARQAQSMVHAMYLGQSGKILLAAVLFAGVFILVKPLSPFSVFIGYMIMLVVHAVLVAKLFRHRTHFER